MPSERKSAASRSNGAKSKGPKSAETRAKSSRNSLKHGLTSTNTILLDCENPDEFQEMLDGYMAAHQPASAAETDFVHEMVAARWRIQRFWTIETVLLNSEMENRGKCLREDESDHPAVQLAAAFRALADESRVLSLISRYESRLHRIYDRAYQRLRELQQAREMQSTQPAAEPINPPSLPPEEPISLTPKTLQTPGAPHEKLRNEPAARCKLLQFRAHARPVDRRFDALRNLR